MMRIVQVLAVPTVGAGDCDGSAALESAGSPHSEQSTAPPATPGLRSRRQVAEAVSVGLVLDGPCLDSDDASEAGNSTTAPKPGGRPRPVVWGDCVVLAYRGQGGREPLFCSQSAVASILSTVAPALEGRRLTSFRNLAEEVDGLTETVQVQELLPARPRPTRQEGVSRRALITAPARALKIDPGDESSARWVSTQRRLHTAIRYGVSQALLRAVALARGVTMAEVIAGEWDLPLPAESVPIHAQSSSDRCNSAERMIARRIASLPHALVDDIPRQFGADGSELTRYIRWLVERISSLGGQAYQPTIHLDVHGALGQVYENQTGPMLGQLYAWEFAARPYSLRIESPMIMDSLPAQLEAMRTLREYVRLRKMSVKLVADEWATTLENIRAFIDHGAADMIQIKVPDLGGVQDTVEAVLACRAGGVSAFLGGSNAETDISSRVSVHIALGTRPDMIMAMPGLDTDQAISTTQNEMARALAEIGVA